MAIFYIKSTFKHSFFRFLYSKQAGKDVNIGLCDGERSTQIRKNFLKFYGSKILTSHSPFVAKHVIPQILSIIILIAFLFYFLFCLFWSATFSLFKNDKHNHECYQSNSKWNKDIDKEQTILTT